MRNTFLTILLSILSTQTFADSGTKALNVYQRLTGVPASADVIEKMKTLFDQGKHEEAVAIAIEDPYFYSLTLPNWVTTWTSATNSNRDTTNDFVATVIGVIRDNHPFNQILFGDHLYTLQNTENNFAAYSLQNNDHYKVIDEQFIDLKSNLVHQPQSSINNIDDSAGVLTTRAFAQSFLNGGTNRRQIVRMFDRFLCRDIKQLADTSTPDHFVRRDVDRASGEDFRFKCAGCHGGMDPFSSAFAYFDFSEGELIYSKGNVAAKYSSNSGVFPEGFVVLNNSWSNLWINGSNSSLGWRGEPSGTGVKSLGEYFSKSEAFSQCMAKRTFTHFCLHEPEEEELDIVNALGKDFEANNYNMKKLITKTVLSCVRE